MSNYFGEVNSGKLRIYSKESFDKEIASLDGKKIVLELKVRRKIRSTGKITEKGNQNGYFYGVMLPIIAEWMGCFPEEAKAAVEVQFCRIGGTDRFPIVKPIKKHNTLEFEELMEKIRIFFLTEFNVNIPTVEDYYNLENKYEESKK